MTRIQAIAIVILLWALLYLPALGTTELKGEEGRRAMPGVTMLETGNWIVPQVGGEDYLRKPPLVNWAAAAGIKLLGRQDEWAVRLPSVIAVLLLGLTLVIAGSAWLTPEGALLAAIFALTNISLLEKGRLVEIEALYIAFTGMAIAIWVGLWLRRSSVWWLWMMPALFLGLGMLTKGPVHLLFFYGVVIPILWFEGRGALRKLLHPGHFVGIAIMLGIFALWAVPLLRETAGGETASTWSNQFSGRVSGEGFSFAKWLENIPRSVLNFLPWALFLPLLWRKEFLVGCKPEVANVARGLRWGMVVTFAVITLLPGSVPRYTLPLITPASLLLALAFVPAGRVPFAEWVEPVWRWVLVGLGCVLAVAALAVPFVVGWSAGHVVIALALGFAAAGLVWTARVLRRPASLAIATAVLLGIGMVVYAVGVVPKVVERDDLRPSAAKINNAVPDDQLLYILKPGFQPVMFYLQRPLRCITSRDQIDDEVFFLLVREKDVAAVTKRRDWKGARQLTTIRDRRDDLLVLLSR